MSFVKFTKEQKEYLLFNARWLHNKRFNEWINDLSEVDEE